MAEDSLQSTDSHPSMQQDSHPEHNMPEPEHDGTTLSTEAYPGQNRGIKATNYSVQPAKGEYDK